MAPVLQQSLHMVPISIRIGYLSCAAYCLALRPPLVTVKELNTFLIKEVIAEVTEESERNYLGNLATRGARALIVTRLRVESIKLMSAVLASDEVRKNVRDYQEVKNNIVRVFFRCLMNRSKDIVTVAKQGPL
jgi:hypothetical protein